MKSHNRPDVRFGSKAASQAYSSSNLASGCFRGIPDTRHSPLSAAFGQKWTFPRSFILVECYLASAIDLSRRPIGPVLYRKSQPPKLDQYFLFVHVSQQIRFHRHTP